MEYSMFRIVAAVPFYGLGIGTFGVFCFRD
jgi:hypothetical protein